MEKYNSNKSRKSINKWIRKHSDQIHLMLKKTFEERQKMEQQIQGMIDKTELEVGVRQVKIQGNSCYAQVPRKWKDRKVLVLLLREEDQPKNS